MKEGIAKLLCLEKLMILRLFVRGSVAATDRLTRQTPSESGEENGRKQPQKGDFNGRMSFTNPSKERFRGYTLFSVIVAAMGGFLFGYHTGIISGALIFLAPAFSLSPIDEGFVVSIILLGALGGALISGTLADWLGRKKTILLTALIFILGATIISVSQTFFFLSVGRAVTGIAVGIISMTAPLYIAEISPPHYRGRFVS